MAGALTAVVPPWAAVAAVLAATLLGWALARRFDGVRLPGWSAAPACALAGGLACALPPATVAATLWTMALVVPLTALALIDAATRQIPDLLSFALILLGLGQTAMAGGPVAAVGLAVAALVIVALVSDRLLPAAAVGAGDILLAAAAVAWVGLAPLLELLIIAALVLWAQALLRLGLQAAGRLPQAAGGTAMAPALALALAAIWLTSPG